MKRDLIDDMLLFNNDLREYKVSIEGKFVLACYDMADAYHNETILEDAEKYADKLNERSNGLWYYYVEEI